MTLSYEKCKELKEAGFPQTEDPNVCGHCGDGGPNNDVRMPTLSELIEACGDRLYNIDFLHDMNLVIARGYGKNEIIEMQATNPEEAVANLYLALKKK